jgi:hypothetical protein
MLTRTMLPGLLVVLLAPPALPHGWEFAQAGGVHGQGVMAGKGEGPTGWVQAPLARGQTSSGEQRDVANAQGVPPSAAKGSSPQPSPGENPGTPAKRSLPGPSGIDPASPRK